MSRSATRPSILRSGHCGRAFVILIEIISCASFEELAVDENGDVRGYTPEAYGESKTTLGVRTPDDLTFQIDRATERRGGGASPSGVTTA